MPFASAVAVKWAPLPSVMVTVAFASGAEVAQAVSAHALTVPEMVKPVTVNVTGIVCGLPASGAPVLSV